MGEVKNHLACQIWQSCLIKWVNSLCRNVFPLPDRGRQLATVARLQYFANEKPLIAANGNALHRRVNDFPSPVFANGGPLRGHNVATSKTGATDSRQTVHK